MSSSDTVAGTLTMESETPAERSPAPKIMFLSSSIREVQSSGIWKTRAVLPSSVNRMSRAAAGNAAKTQQDNTTNIIAGDFTGHPSWSAGEPTGNIRGLGRSAEGALYRHVAKLLIAMP